MLPSEGDGREFLIAMDDAERFPLPSTYPSVEEPRNRLLRACWSKVKATFGSAHALVWIVSGSNGEHGVEDRSVTRKLYRRSQRLPMPVCAFPGRVSGGMAVSLALGRV